MSGSTSNIIEFGDFQTPPALALCATRLLVSMGVRPHSIIEPTCGKGAFVHAAIACFPDTRSILSFDVNGSHLEEARSHVRDARVEFYHANVFQVDWESTIGRDRRPWLVLGNLPWVTSAAMSLIKGRNMPVKSNTQGRRGIDAMTGAGNFDISETLMTRYLDHLDGTDGTLAMICKTSVARKVLLHAWNKGIRLGSATIHGVDAMKEFGAAVDACFLVMRCDPLCRTTTCAVYVGMNTEHSECDLGFMDGMVVNDVATFSKYPLLQASRVLTSPHLWRSGIKHDCSRVMELTPTPAFAPMHGRARMDIRSYVNGHGEAVILEDDFLFPMLKCSDLSNGRTTPRRVMLVPQKKVGEDTGIIRQAAPLTWDYLRFHADRLEKRGSSVYTNKPEFSVFGVGSYSFTPWKVAVSGFHTTPRFVKVGPHEGRPVVHDDTCCFLPCGSEWEANLLVRMLMSNQAQDFLGSMVHRASKRPITVSLLRSLSLTGLAEYLDNMDKKESCSLTS